MPGRPVRSPHSLHNSGVQAPGDPDSLGGRTGGGCIPGGYTHEEVGRILVGPSGGTLGLGDRTHCLAGRWDSTGAST